MVYENVWIFESVNYFEKFGFPTRFGSTGDLLVVDYGFIVVNAFFCQRSSFLVRIFCVSGVVFGIWAQTEHVDGVRRSNGRRNAGTLA